MHSLLDTATSAAVDRRTPRQWQGMHIVTFPCIVAVGGGRPDKQTMCSLSISCHGLLRVFHWIVSGFAWRRPRMAQSGLQTQKGHLKVVYRLASTHSRAQ